MNVFINNLTRIIFLGLTIAFFSGCSSMQSMSSYARTGDTVTISLGGTEEHHALVEILKKEDINIVITDSSSNMHAVTLRHLFRVYPDHTSTYIFNTNHVGGGNSIDAYAPPLLGQWMATVDLVDPVTGLNPVLAEGPAIITVSSAAQLNQGYLYTTAGTQWGWTNGSLAAIAIDILPGTGAPNALNYLGPISHDPVADLEPLPQLIVEPSATPTTNIAGGSFKFVYAASDFTGGIVVVPANHDPNVQLSSNVIDLGDGTKEMSVLIMNPKGFLNSNARTQPWPGFEDMMGIGKMSPLRSARFNIVFKAQAIANSASWQDHITMVEGGYIGLDGVVVTDITPIMKKTR